jgi:membrane protease YdiL (CAAX protease family)
LAGFYYTINILLVIILISTIRFVQLWLVTGELGLHSDLVPSRLIEAVVFVRITKEIVFLGFLLNAFLKKMKMLYAFVLEAALFTLIHYPIWIHNGFDFSQILSSSIFVMVISVGFTYSFIKTRNILVPMALHMVWNLSIHFFMGI